MRATQRPTLCGTAGAPMVRSQDAARSIPSLLLSGKGDILGQFAAELTTNMHEVIGHGYTNSERQSDMDEATETAMIAHATPVCAKGSCTIGSCASALTKSPACLPRERR